MSDQLITTIITVFSTLLVAAGSGVVTWAVANRQDQTARANKAKELDQAKATAVTAAQQQVVSTAVSMLQPLKEQNDWLTNRIQELTSRLEEVEAKLRTELGEKAQLLKENADLRKAYNAMSRKVQKLEQFIRENIGRDIDTGKLDSDPALTMLPLTADPTPPISTRDPFTEPPPPESDNPADWE
jgi:predicted RNase H-like nuclease (RuvC/YqgF family)